MNDTLPLTTPTSVFDTRPSALHDAEVEQLHLAARGDHDVARRDVAVDEADGTARSRRSGGARRPAPPAPRARCTAPAARSAACPSVSTWRFSSRPRSRPTMYSCARKYSSSTLPKSNTGHDVRVHERRAQLRLVDELLDRGAVARDVRAQPLDDEHAPEALGTVQDRRVELGHPALAQPLEQAVASERARPRVDARALGIRLAPASTARPAMPPAPGRRRADCRQRAALGHLGRPMAELSACLVRLRPAPLALAGPSVHPRRADNLDARTRSSRAVPAGRSALPRRAPRGGATPPGPAASPPTAEHHRRSRPRRRAAVDACSTQSHSFGASDVGERQPAAVRIARAARRSPCRPAAPASPAARRCPRPTRRAWPSDSRTGTPVAFSRSCASSGSASIRNVESPRLLGADRHHRGDDRARRRPARPRRRPPSARAPASRPRGAASAARPCPSAPPACGPAVTSAAPRARNGAHQSSLSNRSRIVAASTPSASAAFSCGIEAASLTSISSPRFRPSSAVCDASSTPTASSLSRCDRSRGSRRRRRPPRERPRRRGGRQSSDRADRAAAVFRASVISR